MPLDIDEGALNAHVMRVVARQQQAMASIARSLGLAAPPMTEADRLLALKARAVAPASCGPDMPVAPARGPMVAFAPVEMRPGEDGYDLVHAGFRGRDAARAADAFDLMAAQAKRRGGAEPFTRAQVATGRAYAALVERHAARGVRGISVETMMAGRSGGTAEGWAVLVVGEGRRVEALVRAIGDGVALAPKRNGRRQAVRIRALVDGLCLEGLTLAVLLRRWRWDDGGATMRAARDAVGAALDRMALVQTLHLGLDA